jgi:two-component system LytT family sensor kinase
VLGQRFGIERLFYLGTGAPWTTLAVLLATVLTVAIPIKIWNSARIEHKLQVQETLLQAARFEALANQINPHFLFNTLASISSLIRSQPETARLLIVRLSVLLRRRLSHPDHFVPLREEVAAVDEYLDIERVRFGPRLVVEKALAPETLDAVVPSMILQPLVENSLKHGLASQLGEGRILIRSWREADRTVVEVSDNGAGMTPDRLAEVMGAGIGLRNVDERLKVVHGRGAGLSLRSTPGEGTKARLDIPDGPPTTLEATAP